MSLDTIRDTVTRAAQAEAARAIQEAEEKAAQRLEIQKTTLRAEAEQQYQSRSRALEGEFSRRLSQKKSAANKQLLEARNARLGELFEQARREILAWPASQYGPVMQTFLEQAAGSSPGQVRCHADDRGTFQEVCHRLNRGRPAAAALELDPEGLAERGGFVFVAPDYEVDFTLTARLADIAHELTPELAAELLGG